MGVDSSLNTMGHVCGTVGPAAVSVTVRSHEESCVECREECRVIRGARKGGRVSCVSVEAFCSTGSRPIAEKVFSFLGGGESLCN